jgi:hypothetical protein
MFKIICGCMLVLGVTMVIMGCQAVAPEPDTITQAEMISGPWDGFDVGSFVHYKILMTAGNFAEEKQTVLEIRKNQVILEASALGNTDQWEHKNMLMIPLKVPNKPDKTVKVTDDIAIINGKSLRCKVEKRFITDYEHGNKKVAMQTWISDDVPGGVVRISYDDKVVVEVVDFEKK